MFECGACASASAACYPGAYGFPSGAHDGAAEDPNQKDEDIETVGPFELFTSADDLQREAEGYGAFAKDIDVEAIDLRRFPCWAHLPWVEAALEPGDCLFLPPGWFHHVASDGGEARRSIAVNTWWSKPERFQWNDDLPECREYVR